MADLQFDNVAGRVDVVLLSLLNKVGFTPRFGTAEPARHDACPGAVLAEKTAGIEPQVDVERVYQAAQRGPADLRAFLSALSHRL